MVNEVDGKGSTMRGRGLAVNGTTKEEEKQNRGCTRRRMKGGFRSRRNRRRREGFGETRGNSVQVNYAFVIGLGLRKFKIYF